MPTPGLFIDGLNQVVRYRSPHGMRSLLTQQPASFFFDETEARFDHLQVRMTATVYISHERELETVIGLIAENLGEDAVLRCSGRSGNSFDAYTISDRWLFSASGKIRWQPEALRLSFDLKIHLNPTRFLAHQDTGDIEAIRALSPDDALRFRPERHAQLAATALDGQSNVLVGLDRLGSSAFEQRERHRQELMDVYVNHVRSLFTQALDLRDQNARLDRLELARLGAAEVYWELYHPDAVSFVADLSSAIVSCDRLTRTFEKPLERGGEGNVRWTKLALTGAIDLKFYAKTADRVRCEIVFNGRQGRIEQLVQRVLGTGRTDLFQKLSVLVGDAATRLQRTWTTIMDYTAFTDQTAEVVDFMARLNNAVPEENQRLLLSLLANHRGVAQTSDEGIASPSVCRALSREGILVRTTLRQRAGQSYALAPHYSQMFDRYLGRSDAPPNLRS